MLSFSPRATDCARDIGGVEGADGRVELARDRNGVRGAELARDSEGVLGRSRSGTGGARLHPNRDVRRAGSDGWWSVSTGEGLARSLGLDGGSSSDIGRAGRLIEEMVVRKEATCAVV